MANITIHGNTYDVSAINYVKNGVTSPVSTLVLNGSTVFPAQTGGLPEKKSFSEMTWADIQTVCKAGKASEYWSIGDTKPLGDSGHSVCIIGFDHDTPADTDAYGRSKAGITVETVLCMDGTIQMNNSASTTGGWESCAARKNVISGIPAEYGLESYIVPVIKLCSTGGSTSGQTIKEVIDSAFILSEVEVHGTTLYSLVGEGEQYEWYMDNSAVKGTSDSSDGIIRLTRSPYNTRYYACVTANGNSYYYSANTRRKYSFAFCI